VAAGKKPRKPRKNSKEYVTKMAKWEEDMKLVQSHRLESICKLYNIELNDAHRALNDTEAVYKILRAFKKNNPKIDLDFYINKIGYKKRWKINELSYYPSRIELHVQGTNGERYILDAEEHSLFK
jgi:DNA polymerase III alpha subunit (gram-positive type)